MKKVLAGWSKICPDAIKDKRINKQILPIRMREGAF